MTNSSQKLQISITTTTILKIVFVVVGLIFLWSIRDLAVLMVVALVLSSALDPTVDWLQRNRIPRSLGIVIIYILAASVMSFVVAGIAGPIAEEVTNIAGEVPRYYVDVNQSLNDFMQNSPAFFTDDRIRSFRGGLDEVIRNLTDIASAKGLPVVSAVFGGIVSLILTLVITFYFIVQENAIKHFISWVVPQRHHEETTIIIEKIQKKLGLWIRGQLILSLIIFVISYAGLSLIGVKYALVLSILAGVLEIVPYLGPIMAAVPAIFLTLTASGWIKALLVLALYVLIQQAENHVIMPKVMAKTIGLNPLIVILSILIGAKVAGFVGALIAVPVATGIVVYLHEKGYVGGSDGNVS